MTESLLSRIEGLPSTPPPPRILIYGPEKIGKSTFIAQAPNPVVLDMERGFENIDVKRFEPHTLAEVFAFIDELATSDHDFKTLGIDTADWLEAMVDQVVADEYNAKHIDDIAYKAGYQRATQIFRELKNRLEYLRAAKGMIIIISAHDQIKRFNDPTTDSYDRYQLKLHSGKEALLKEWVDCILFAQNKVHVAKSKEGFGKEIAKAKTTGERVLKTVGTPSYIAGNRLQLPEEIPLSWDALYAAIINSYSKGEKTDG